MDHTLSAEQRAKLHIRMLFVEQRIRAKHWSYGIVSHRKAQRIIFTSFENNVSNDWNFISIRYSLLPLEGINLTLILQRSLFSASSRSKHLPTLICSCHYNILCCIYITMKFMWTKFRASALSGHCNLFSTLSLNHNVG